VALTLDEPILVQQHRGTERSECFVEQTVGRALNASFWEAEELIIKRFEKSKLSDLTAELLDIARAHFSAGDLRRSSRRQQCSKSVARRSTKPALPLDASFTRDIWIHFHELNHSMQPLPFWFRSF
jgi:hypothetical protein